MYNLGTKVFSIPLLWLLDGGLTPFFQGFPPGGNSSGLALFFVVDEKMQDSDHLGKLLPLWCLGNALFSGEVSFKNGESLVCD